MTFLRRSSSHERPRLMPRPECTDTGHVRLTPHQQTEILNTARELFGPKVRVVLFGSRVDDRLRGGDIDLMIDTDLESQSAHEGRLTFLVELKKRIGDRKIDVIVRSPDRPAKPIHDAASRHGVEILG